MTSLLDAYAEQCVSDSLSKEPYKDLIMNQTPPDYPLGYVRERVELHCLCGRLFRYSRLLVVERSSSKGRKIRPCGKSESVYDIEIAEVRCVRGTPVCDECFDTRPREPVSIMPALRERIGKTQLKTLDPNDFMDVTL